MFLKYLLENHFVNLIQWTSCVVYWLFKTAATNVNFQSISLRPYVGESGGEVGGALPYLDVSSFGFSIFCPAGASVLSMWVQLRSTLFRMVEPCGLLGGALMNSRTDMVMSLKPLWSGREKCLPMVFSWLEISMSLKWWTNLSFIRREVWPTYCLWHLLQVMA